MFQMFAGRAVADSPLCSLLNGEESKGTITFARRSLALAELWADAARRLTSAIADKQHLLQARDGLLRSANNNSIANRCAVAQHGLLDSFQGWVAAAFGRRRHHLAHRLGRDKVVIAQFCD